MENKRLEVGNSKRTIGIREEGYLKFEVLHCSNKKLVEWECAVVDIH